MNDSTKDTLESIERMLVRNFTSPRSALQAAYQLGRMDGMLEMARVGEERVSELTKAAA